ncbi:MAG: hypothetical protein QM785_02315 [Pyrinomonadaceae bacterium]
MIRRSPELKALDDLCGAVPVPMEASLLGKAKLHNGTGILYFYSNPGDRELLESDFKIWFKSEGWQSEPADTLSRTTRFVKGELEVNVTVSNLGNGIDLSLSCKSKTANKINEEN